MPTRSRASSRGNWRPAALNTADVRTVISIGDGIAGVRGVERAMPGEMLGFPNGVFGIALNLEEDCVGGALLGRRSTPRS
jgi:F0F1-type ATP synthase alpha subunit